TLAHSTPLPVFPAGASRFGGLLAGDTSIMLMTKDTWLGVYRSSHFQSSRQSLSLQYRSEITMLQNAQQLIADDQLDQYLYAIVFALARRQMRQRWGSRRLTR